VDGSAQTKWSTFEQREVAGEQAIPRGRARPNAVIAGGRGAGVRVAGKPTTVTQRRALRDDVAPQASAPEFREDEAGQIFVVMRGALDFRAAAALRERLTRRFSGRVVRPLTIDMGAVERGDTLGMVVLHEMREGRWALGIRAQVVGLRPELRRIASTFPRVERGSAVAPAAPRRRLVETAGRWSIELVRAAREHVAFVGAVVEALTHAIRRPRTMRWREVARAFEKAGVDALPVVSLVSGLLGVSLALEAAPPLARFGAQIFTATAVGRGVLREMGPLITAIVLAGRSGSAFAAELGTMKVNDELDALSVMGLDPVRFLVVQRVVAGTLLSPLLASYASAVAIVGGLLAMRALGFAPALTWSVLVDSVTTGDALLGIAKSVAFGAAVAAIGCERGLQTKHGPSAVGLSATRAVVGGVVLVVAFDAAAAVVAYAMNL
jgi:phospholipid/cholesterol/gamma-HCH transport system permease protein